MFSIKRLFCKHKYGKPISYGFRTHNVSWAVQTLQKTCEKCGKKVTLEQKVTRDYVPGYNPNI